MSAAAAVVVVSLVLTAAGLGALALLGVARSPRELVGAAALAPLAGMAWVGVVAATAAAAGVGLGLLALVFVAVVTCGAGAVRLVRAGAARPAEAARAPGSRLELALAALALGLLAAVSAFALVTYSDKPLVEYDGWAMWGMKAKAIAWLDADAAVLGSATYERLHLEYPLLLPALHAFSIDAAGSYDSRIVVLSCVAVGLAGLLALWGLLRDRARPALVLPFLAALAAMPAFYYQLGSGYADAPLAAFVGAGVATGARWLLEGETRWLALATLFLAAAALTKNEGLLFALAALAALFAVARGRRRAVALAAAVVAAAYAPWRAYIAVHDLGSPAYDLSDSFDPGWVAPRLRRVPEAVSGVLEQALRAEEVGFLVAVGVALGVLAYVFRRAPLGAFAVAFALLSLGGLAWIYVISPLEVESFVESSAHRVVLSVVVGLAALSPLLLEELAAGSRSSEPPGSLSSSGRASAVLGRHPPP